MSTTQKFALLAERVSGRKASIIGDYVLQLSRSYYETLHRDCASFVGFFCRGCLYRGLVMLIGR